MSKVDYAAAALGASEAIRDAGKPMTLRIQAGATYDYDTQTNVPVYADYPVYGVVLNYSGRTNESGTYVQTDDKKLLLSVSNAPEPTTGAQVIDGADVYTVQSVKSLAPAGINLLFELQGRK
ncbi:MAG: hypothetical protein ACRCUH_10290 [Shewanella sp.]